MKRKPAVKKEYVEYINLIDKEKAEVMEDLICIGRIGGLERFKFYRDRDGRIAIIEDNFLDDVFFVNN